MMELTVSENQMSAAGITCIFGINRPKTFKNCKGSQIKKQISHSRPSIDAAEFLLTLTEPEET